MSGKLNGAISPDCNFTASSLPAGLVLKENLKFTTGALKFITWDLETGDET